MNNNLEWTITIVNNFRIISELSTWILKSPNILKIIKKLTALYHIIVLFFVFKAEYYNYNNQDSLHIVSLRKKCYILKYLKKKTSIKNNGCSLKCELIAKLPNFLYILFFGLHWETGWNVAIDSSTNRKDDFFRKYIQYSLIYLHPINCGWTSGCCICILRYSIPF